MSAIARPSREMRSVGTLKARELATAMTPWGDCGPQAVCAPVDERHGNDWAFFLSDRRVRLRKRQALFRPGDCSAALYLLRVGFIMTMMPTPDGAEHVLGFHLPGELVGLEGMGKDAHTCNALALEDSEVCMLPILGIYKVAREDMLFQRHLYRMLSCAIVEERRVALMLGTMRAEQRVASFLLDLGTRYGKCGYSSTAYVLRMTRADIGSHLGLKLETVSRLLSRFAEEGLIGVNGREIRLLNPIEMEQLVTNSEPIGRQRWSPWPTRRVRGSHVVPHAGNASGY